MTRSDLGFRTFSKADSFQGAGGSGEIFAIVQVGDAHSGPKVRSTGLERTSFGLNAFLLDC